jgi:hypothetical protein
MEGKYKDLLMDTATGDGSHHRRDGPAASRPKPANVPSGVAATVWIHAGRRPGRLQAPGSVREVGHLGLGYRRDPGFLT